METNEEYIWERGSKIVSAVTVGFLGKRKFNYHTIAVTGLNTYIYIRMLHVLITIQMSDKKQIHVQLVKNRNMKNTTLSEHFLNLIAKSFLIYIETT